MIPKAKVNEELPTYDDNLQADICDEDSSCSSNKQKSAQVDYSPNSQTFFKHPKEDKDVRVHPFGFGV